MQVPMMSAVRDDGSHVRVEEVRRLRPASGEVLVRVAAVSVDRADAEPETGPWPVRFDTTPGRTLGRHLSGTVAAPGVGVEGWPLGRAVVVQPEFVSRGSWLRLGVEHDGALADYVSVPARALVPVPKGMEPSYAAQVVAATRVDSMLEHARLTAGESLGIWGGGALGAAAVVVARARGAAPIVVVDPDEDARAQGRDLGADVCLDPHVPDFAEHVRESVGGGGLDVALHLAPDARAAEQTLAALGPVGRGVLAGPARWVESPRWDARTLSGVPPLDPAALPRLLRLAALGRLVLPVRPRLDGGLGEAAHLLDAAVRTGSGVRPFVVCL